MSVLFAYFVALLATGPVPLDQQGPLGLKWGEEYQYTTTPPDGFRYYMGDIDWGTVVFIGTRDFLGAETELQIFFTKKKISRAILILGPEGVSHNKCFQLYRQLVNLLEKKYGPFKHKEVRRDPTVDELLFVSACYPLSLGMISVKNIWLTKEYKIISSLIGDHEGVYIEIEYILTSMSSQESSLKEGRILKRL